MGHVVPRDCIVDFATDRILGGWQSITVARAHPANAEPSHAKKIEKDWCARIDSLLKERI